MAPQRLRNLHRHLHHHPGRRRQRQRLNTGQAAGTPPAGPVVTATNTVKIPAIDDPPITLEKSASVQSFSTVGTSITYTYR